MRSHTILHYDNTNIVELQDSIKSARITNNQRLLVQIFYGGTKVKQLETLISELRSLLPDCKMIGCSSGGEIHSSMLLNNVIMVNFLQFERSSLAVRMVPFTDSNDLTYFNCGELLGNAFNKQNPKLLLSYACGENLNAESYARGLVSKHPKTTLAGAVASNSHGQPSLIIYNNKISQSGAVVAAIYGDELEAQIHHSADWMMLGTPMKVTEARENLLISINDQPAAEIYQRYLGDEVTRNAEVILDQFPLIAERNGRVVALKCRTHELNNGGMEFLGNFKTDEIVRFGMSDPVAAMSSSKAMLDHIKESRPEAALFFGSIARKLSLSEMTVDEIKMVQTVLSTTGIISSGQFLYTEDQPDYLHYARTILTLSEGQQAPLNLNTAREVHEYSDQTRQLRAFSHLVGTTKQEQDENLAKQERLANTDLLTDLYNRRKIMNLLNTEMKRAQRYGRTFSIIMFDLDDFKQVNDNHGHQAGDTMLSGIGQIITDQARDTDLCARWGGEEFLVICPETNIQGATEIAERFRRATESATLLKGVRLTLSLGVTEFKTEDSIDALLNRADKALYDAKDKGKNQLTVWE